MPRAFPSERNIEVTTMLEILAATTLVLSNLEPHGHWAYSCMKPDFSENIKPDYYEIGLIYYNYNKDPAFEAGLIPIFIDTKSSHVTKHSAYRFYVQGKSNVEIYYILDDKKNIVSRFLNTPFTKCIE